jgi:pyruvate/2-oxoglutarate/acetoin dehydrogenase E1 component
MRAWLLATAAASEEELVEIETNAVHTVRAAQRAAWTDYNATIVHDKNEAIKYLLALDNKSTDLIADGLNKSYEPSLKDIYGSVRKAIRLVRHEHSDAKQQLLRWYKRSQSINSERFNSKLFTDGVDSPDHVPVKPVEYSDNARMVDGREVLNACFEENFKRDPRLLSFGEDVGKIGDVNQGFAGLQNIFGEDRIFDTGIRENTIIGQGIGLALRGLRPIAEIQYLDYLLYAITALSDDLASLSYRTKAGQKAPLIIRTRGHRLEGIWHSGSPMGMILGSLRGLHVCVPRNMTQAAGMYNTLLRSDEPALVIECLNGYRIKERLPDNPGEFTVPLGIAEIVNEGKDVTVVSYGSTLRIVQEAAQELERLGIFIEIVDLQTLQPFDKEHLCASSLSKTSKLLVVDEDVPGGASAFILQNILEEQKGYFQLDAQPRTLTAKAHRPPYGSDGDYFTKPSVDDVIEMVYFMMHEAKPEEYPSLF